MERVDPAPTPPTGAAGEGASTVAPSTLGWLFLRIGATSFGDTGPLLAMIERDLVEERRALTGEDITEALTYTKFLPGSTVLQVVSYLGYKLGGWPVSALVTVAYILPSSLAMVLLAAGYLAVSDVPAIAPAIQGLTAAVVGVLLATAYRLGKKNKIDEPLTVGILAVAFFAGAFLGVNAAVIVVVAGLVGVVLLAGSTGAGQPAGEARR